MKMLVKHVTFFCTVVVNGLVQETVTAAELEFGAPLCARAKVDV